MIRCMADLDGGSMSIDASRILPAPIPIWVSSSPTAYFKLTAGLLLASNSTLWQFLHTIACFCPSPSFCLSVINNCLELQSLSCLSKSMWSVSKMDRYCLSLMIKFPWFGCFSEGAVLKDEGNSLASNKRILLRNFNKHLLQTPDLHFEADNMDGQVWNEKTVCKSYFKKLLLLHWKKSTWTAVMNNTLSMADSDILL